MANIFINEFVARHGPPEFLHTNQAKNFESNLMKEVCQLLGVSKTRTTPYHPQSNGVIERFNRTLLLLLSMAASDNEVGLDKKLPMVIFAYCTSVHESTKSTPFSLMYGREVRLPIDIMFGAPEDTPSSVHQYARELASNLDKAYNDVREHLQADQCRQKDIYDRRVSGPSYACGDLVWLHSPAVPKGRSKKLHRPWQGPFTVTKVLSDVIFRIKKDTPPRKNLVVHYNRLKPYKLSTNCQPDPLDPWDYLVGDPTHTSDNEQGLRRPRSFGTTCQLTQYKHGSHSRTTTLNKNTKTSDPLRRCHHLLGHSCKGEDGVANRLFCKDYRILCNA